MADDPEVDPDELELEPEAEPEIEAEPEPEAEAEPESEPEVAEPEQQREEVRTQDRQPSRAEKRISSQQEALRASEQRNADLNKRLDALIAQGVNSQQQQNVESPAQREQRLALLDPVERMRVEMHESQQVSTRQMQAMAFQLQDSGDKATFDAKGLVDPLYSKWAPKVESFLSELRGKGQNVGREQALKYLIGEAALANRKPASTQQRREAAGRMTRNRTQPSNARSDTQVNRRGGSDSTALERRLDNVNI